MRIENGRVIYETEPCVWCHGDKTVKDIGPCPRDGKNQHGQPCPYCGRTRKPHVIYDSGRVLPCRHCNARGFTPETRYSWVSEELWQSLVFCVYRSQRAQTLNERLYGFGCCWTTTDYGTYQKLTDAELIEKVRTNVSRPQACHVVDETDRLPNHIGIICNREGYVVKAVHLRTSVGTRKSATGPSARPSESWPFPRTALHQMGSRGKRERRR